MLLHYLELVGIAAFAASGALVGVAKRLDMFGVVCVGVFTGIGGGIVRDILLDIHPPTSLTSWANFGTAAIMSLVVFYAHTVLDRLRRAVLTLDALGMGLFATTGAVIALEHDSGPLAACLIGGTAAIGGGVMRDVLVNEMPLLLHRDLYAVPALMGAALVVIVMEAGGTNNLALVIGTGFAMGLRLVSLWRKWSLPAPRNPS